MLGRASDQDALKLVLAFYCIMESERRSELIALAEKLAKESTVVERVTHFMLLDDPRKP